MDNNLLLIFIFMLLYSQRINEFNGLKSFSYYIRSIRIEPKYTLEKIKLLKKIGPYFPEEYIPTINRAILFTERMIKFNELVSFMKNDEQYIKEALPIKDNRERISKIFNIVQKELSKNDYNNLGMMLDLIVNMDKYKNFISMFNSLKSQEDIKEPSQLINLLGPALGIDVKDKEKLKDINKMMEIIKVLNAKKDSSTNRVAGKLPEKNEDHLKDN
ncbi:MAG TPA: hypothetical protein VIK77_04165 [Tissierellaceae bacterium]